MPPKQPSSPRTLAARRQFEVGHAATFPAAFPRMLADFSSFVRTFQPSDFAQMLADGRQVEQLWSIGETFRSIPVGNLETLPEVFEVLFPGRSHQGFWTPPELFLIRYTTFAQLLQTLLPGVPATLSAEHFCQFMVYTTLPLVTFRRKVETLWRHGEFTLQSSDVFWGQQVLNFSFSARSAFLLYIFGFSFLERSGVTFPQLLPGFVTLGFRLSLERWAYFLNHHIMWNRKYIDFFLAIRDASITFRASEPTDAATLCSCVVLSHHAATSAMVSGMNSLFDSPTAQYFRLYHLPIHQHFWQAVMNLRDWDFIPRAVLQCTLRARL